MSLKEFIFSDEFKTYRRKQVKEIVRLLKDSLVNHPESIKPQWHMAKVILGLPEKLINDEKVKVDLQRLLNEDFNHVYVDLARQGIMEDEIE